MTLDFSNLDKIFGAERQKTLNEAVDKSRPQGQNEAEKSESLTRSLNRNGIAAEASRGKNGDVLGRDFVIEGKSSLTSKSVLDRLKGQIDGYVRNGQRNIVVVVYGDAKKSLLSELKSFCGRYWADARVNVKVKGNVVEDTKEDDGLFKIF